MPEQNSMLKVRLDVEDLVPVIQKKGEQQGLSVAGQYSHTAYHQARLLLASEDLYTMLSKMVKDAKKGREGLLPRAISTTLLDEASELLERVYHTR